MQASHKPLIIGISGVARSGKDTFASILTTQLKAVGKSVDKFAFADALKKDCDSFCKEKLGVSAFTQVPEEKLIIRPLLVWYGDAKRKQSNGRYWVDIIDNRVKESTADFCLVTDVRYDYYESDEVEWLKNDRKGVLIHVSQFSWMRPSTTKVSTVPMTRVFVPPANDHEMLNDPKVAKKADVRVEWENVGKLSSDEMLASPVLNKHVSDVVRGYILTA
jgi:carbamoylphosphate synthase large subunit